jgi:hypothetical protein
VHDRALFAAMLAEDGSDAESASYLVGRLPARFDEAELERAITAWPASGSPGTAARSGTEELARRIARCSYEVEFSPRSAIAERVLWPHGPSEARGMEDARFVRVASDDGSPTYRATYTAFDGTRIAPQMMRPPTSAGSGCPSSPDRP